MASQCSRLVTRGLATLLLVGAATTARAQFNFIISGTPAPEMRSVGALFDEAGFFCGGTVIARRTVLTSAMCLAETKSLLRFFLGPDVGHTDGGRFIDVVDTKLAPVGETVLDGDLAIAVLAEDAGVDALRVNTEGLDAGDIGTLVTFVGYGVTRVPDVNYETIGPRRKVASAISEVLPAFFGNAAPQPCFGDAGGPGLVVDPDGQLRILGVISASSDGGCFGVGYNTRVDHFADFIAPYLDPPSEVEPVAEPAPEPVAEAAPEPAAEPVPEPAVESAAADTSTSPVEPDGTGAEVVDSGAQSGSDGCSAPGSSTGLLGLGLVAAALALRRRAGRAWTRARVRAIPRP